jgi:hypothetical protein
MLRFSADPNLAEQQMRAIIFYLTAFGYVDGDFDRSEKTFVRGYIRELVEARAADAMRDADAAVRADVIERFTRHFHEVFEEIDRDVRALFTEVVAEGEALEHFVAVKLKLRSYEIFKSFDVDNQAALLETIDELIAADGKVHPAEAAFRAELRGLLAAPMPDVDVSPEGEGAGVEIAPPIALPPKQNDHPFFKPAEQHYSADPVRIRRQAEADHKVIVSAMQRLDAQRAAGAGKLKDRHKVDDLLGQPPFLDGHVYVHPIEEGREYEVVVLGDLHGCYSCLKAAILQSDFFAKVEAWRLEPRGRPEPKLVLLGDYIDRGRFSYNGVLRTALQLFLAAPEHVYVLRGNHEYYLELNGKIYGGVRPAEAINTLVGHMPNEMFEAYMRLFEALPSILLFGRTLFVHAGIPRDAALRERYVDLASLNDAELRFQMLWSDPSEADYIPEELQAQNARFPFGRLQFERFMDVLGCNAMVRGHEKVNEGFRTLYDGGRARVLNVFSAGGAANADLPVDSSYRDVVPMALTMHLSASGSRVVPWAIDYARFNDPANNGFFARPPEIEHRAG